MAGTVIDRQLAVRPASRVHFRLATMEDDPAIRRLLRENPMRGQISVSFEREPDYFRGTALAGAEDRTILAYEQGQLICMGRCSVRQRYFNGTPRRVGYLSDLRLDASAHGRFDVLRRGYQFFRELHDDDPLDCCFTSIPSDNVRSLRFLERGLPGMPAYRLLTHFVTLLIPVPRRMRTLRRLTQSAQRRLESRKLTWSAGSIDDIMDIAALLNVQGQSHQLASTWTEVELQTLERAGLKPGDFRVVCNERKAVACVALWDQRSFKQTVIRGYDPKIAFARPWINVAARLAGTSRLPPIGSTLEHASLSPLAVDAGAEDLLVALVELCLPMAAERGLEFLTVGFGAADRRLAALAKHFPCRKYFSRLYRVDWPGRISETADDRPFFPEVAWL